MYKVGDIFYLDDEYSEKAIFCNENHLVINEIEADEKGRRFQICEIPTESENVKIKREIDKLKENLANTDYQAIKYAEGMISEENYQSIKEQRQKWRDEINNYEETLKEVEKDGE